MQSARVTTSLELIIITSLIFVPRDYFNLSYLLISVHSRYSFLQTRWNHLQPELYSLILTQLSFHTSPRKFTILPTFVLFIILIFFSSLFYYNHSYFLRFSIPLQLSSNKSIDILLNTRRNIFHSY